MERSGYGEFIETLNAFVKEKSLPSKITTVLYLLDERLQKAIRETEPHDDDEDVAALEEHYLQQRHIYFSTRAQLPTRNKRFVYILDRKDQRIRFGCCKSSCCRL